MKYEEEAKQFWITPMDETISGTVKWLRQHDALLLREMANSFDGAEHSDYHWHEVSDILERRAREIEAEIGH